MSLVIQTCQNNLGFSLYAVPSVYHIVTISNRKKKFKMEVSTDWCVVIEYWRSSSIRVIFIMEDRISRLLHHCHAGILQERWAFRLDINKEHHCRDIFSG